MGRKPKPENAPRFEVTSTRFTKDEKEVINLRAAMNAEAWKSVKLYGKKLKLGSAERAALLMVIDRPHLIRHLRGYVGPMEIPK
jgi:hypothetical protein